MARATSREHRTVRDAGELGLLAALGPLLRRHTRGLPLGTGDDVAVTNPLDGRIAWTIDTMVEGTHFRRWPGVSMESLGRKLAESNLSDLASKGAVPRFALVSLACPGTTPLADLRRLYQGLSASLQAAGARLVGGDTVRAPQVTLTLAITGELAAGAGIPARHKARAGQRLYVTETLGDSAAGLMLLEAGRQADSAGLVTRHLEPTARWREGTALAAALPDLAMIDISDGLAIDASRVAAASRVQLELRSAAIPLSGELRRVDPHPLETALHGGEDYELLFATSASPRRVESVLRDAGLATRVTCIGRVLAGAGVMLRGRGGCRAITPQGFEHFAP